MLFRFSGDSLEAKYFELNRNTGQIYAKASIPENEFVQPVTLVIKATQYDNPDRYTVTTLTVTRDGQVGGGELEHKLWGSMQRGCREVMNILWR